MTSHELSGAPPYFFEALLFLTATVLVVPVAKRIGLGAIVGFLLAGIAIGPFGLNLFANTDKILTFSELGVVLLLFVIGLELEPSRIWRMRLDIIVLGNCQLLLTTIFVAAGLMLAGFEFNAAFLGGAGLALSSTAFALQLLQERGQLPTAYGQRAFGILLMQDMAIVPLMAMVPLLSEFDAVRLDEAFFSNLGVGLAAIIFVIGTGRFLLTPLFSILASAHAREVMLAAALLVSLGSAAILYSAGLSMALGAFLAGAMLAESRFRHAIAADIDPFRTILMALFFIAIGMTLNLELVFSLWPIVAAGVFSLMCIKGAILWLLSRLFGSNNSDAVKIAVTLGQGGELSFVLFTAAAGAAILTPTQSSLLVAITILTMILTPPARALHDMAADHLQRRGWMHRTIEPFTSSCPCILIGGFGRFGMAVIRMLVPGEFEIIVIDNQMSRVETARKQGLRSYYGDATRADVLAAAGGHRAAIIVLCVSDAFSMSRRVASIRNRFPNTKLYCRASDRENAIELSRGGVDYHVRETFESGLSLARAVLTHMEITVERIGQIEEDVRRQDKEEFAKELGKKTGRPARS